MSVLDWKEDHTKQTVTDSDRGFTAQRVFTVTLTPDTHPNLAPFEARMASGVPKWNDPHPYSTFIRATNMSVSPVNALFYEITVTYDSVEGFGGEGEDPLSAPWDIEWSFNSVNEPIDKDINNMPILNSSGEPFDPPITEDYHDLVLRIARNEAIFYPLDADRYMHSVNSDLFLGVFAPGTAKMVNFSAHQVTYEGGVYNEVNYGIHFRSDGWNHRVLDQGYRKYTGTDSSNKPTYETFVDDSGSPVSQPIMLNGEGDKLDDGANPVYLLFATLKSEPFSTFGFDEYIF